MVNIADKLNPADRAIQVLALLFCVWFFAATFYSAFHIELGFDPAYHAVVAKNFVQGYGWATSYDSRFLFNPDVTTGPAMLLPAAAMISMFGNAVWVPGVTAAVLQLLLYAAILWRLRLYFDQARPFYLTLIALNLIFVICAHTWWLTLTADFLVCLSLMLASLFLASPNTDHPNRNVLIAGLLLGYALLAKVMAYFGLVAFVVFEMLRWWRSRDRALTLKRAAALVIGVMAVVVPWKIYEQMGLRELNAAETAERANYKQEFFLTQGTGIQEILQADSIPGLILENVVRNGDVLLTHLLSRYHLPAQAAILLILVLFAYTLIRMRKAETELQKLLLLFGLIASSQLFWFLFISHSWIAKYALTPITMAVVMLCLVLAQAGRLLPGIVLISVLALFLPAQSKSYVATLLTFGAGPSAYTRDLLSTRDYLVSHKSTVPLAGCGWVFAPWEMEYALPEPGNFRDCRRLIADSLKFDEEDYLLRNPDVQQEITQGRYASAHQHHLQTNQDGRRPFRYTWVKPVEFVLVVSHIFWEHSVYRDQYQAVFDACMAAPLHRTEYFTAAYCSPDALRQHIPLDRPSEFLPTAENYHYIHKPAPVR